MPKLKKLLRLGAVDPITIIGILFLLIALGVGAYVVSNKGLSLNINEKAGVDGGLDTLSGNANGRNVGTTNNNSERDAKLAAKKKQDEKAADDPVQQQPVSVATTKPKFESGCSYGSGGTLAVGSKVVGGANVSGTSVQGTSGYAICDANLGWIDCPTCNNSNLTVTPTYIENDLKSKCNNDGNTWDDALNKCVTPASTNTQVSEPITLAQNSSSGYISLSDTVRNVEVQSNNIKYQQQQAQQNSANVKKDSNSSDKANAFDGINIGGGQTSSLNQATKYTHLTYTHPSLATNTTTNSLNLINYIKDKLNNSPELQGIGQNGISNNTTLLITQNINQTKETTLDKSNQTYCNKPGLSPEERQRCTNIARLNAYSLPLISDYLDAYKPENMTYNYNLSGYDSASSCLSDPNNFGHYERCSGYKPTAEQIYSASKLGSAITTAGAFIGATPGILEANGIIQAATTAFNTYSAANTASSLVNLPGACASGDDCLEKTVQTAINWVFLGSVDNIAKATKVLSGSQAVNAIRLNAVASGAQVGVNVINTSEACANGGADCGLNIAGDLLLAAGIYQNGVMANALNQSYQSWKASQNSSVVIDDLLPEITNIPTAPKYTNITDGVIISETHNALLVNQGDMALTITPSRPGISISLVQQTVANFISNSVSLSGITKNPLSEIGLLNSSFNEIDNTAATTVNSPVIIPSDLAESTRININDTIVNDLSNPVRQTRIASPADNPFRSNDPLTNITRPISDWMTQRVTPVADWIAGNIIEPNTETLGRIFFAWEPTILDVPNIETITRDPNTPIVRVPEDGLLPRIGITDILFAPVKGPVISEAGGGTNLNIPRPIANAIEDLTVTIPNNVRRLTEDLRIQATNAISDIFLPTRPANPHPPLTTRIRDWIVNIKPNQVKKEMGLVDNDFLPISNFNSELSARELELITQLQNDGIEVYILPDNKINRSSSFNSSAPEANNHTLGIADFPSRRSLTLSTSFFDDTPIRSQLSATLIHERTHILGPKIPNIEPNIFRFGLNRITNEVIANDMAYIYMVENNYPSNAISIQYSETLPYYNTLLDTISDYHQLINMPNEFVQFVKHNYTYSSITGFLPTVREFYINARNGLTEFFSEYLFRPIGNTLTTPTRTFGVWFDDTLQSIVNRFNGIRQPDLGRLDTPSVIRLTADQDIAVPATLLNNNVGQANPRFTETDSTITQDLPPTAKRPAPTIQDAIEYSLPSVTKAAKYINPTFPIVGLLSLGVADYMIEEVFDIDIFNFDSNNQTISQGVIVTDKILSIIDNSNQERQNFQDQNASFNTQPQDSPTIAPIFSTQSNSEFSDVLIYTSEGPRPFRLIGCGPTAVANILNQLGLAGMSPLQIAQMVDNQDWGYYGTNVLQGSSLINILKLYGVNPKQYTNSLQYSLANDTNAGDIILVGAKFKYNGGTIDHISYLQIQDDGRIKLMDNFMITGAYCTPNSDSSLSCENSKGEHLTIDVTNMPIYLINNQQKVSIPQTPIEYKTTVTGGATNISYQNQPSSNEFVYFNQKDPQWQYLPTYGDTTFADKGCGIMTGAMVTGTNPEIYYQAYRNYQQTQGNVDLLTNSGTNFNVHMAVLKDMGCETIPIAGSFDEIKVQIGKYTESGTPVWVNAEIYGYGHNAMATGIDESGNLILNDPWRSENTVVEDKYIKDRPETPWRFSAVICNN